MPGGIAGVREMIDEFHRRGVKVYFPVTVWDRGTRDEGLPDWQAATKLMATINADGLNGDTLSEFPMAARTASDQSGHPIALEPQVSGREPGEALAWNNISWNDWILMGIEHKDWLYPFVPEVSADKWIEPRHQVNLSDRWQRIRLMVCTYIL